jgi:opacity protein-like surface antigen
MKKLLAVSLLACLAATAFALDLSAGAGGTVGSFSSTYHYEEWGLVDAYTDHWTTLPFGFSAFFDATYAIASIGFRANGNTRLQNTTVIFGSEIKPPAVDDNYSSGFLSLSLLGRYPFALGQFSLFPLAGVEYDVILYYHDENGADLDKTDLSQFWFKFGAGADIPIVKGLYIRPLALFGFKLLNSDEKSTLANAKANAASASFVDFLFEGGVQAGWRF